VLVSKTPVTGRSEALSHVFEKDETRGCESCSPASGSLAAGARLATMVNG
jgi:hypothetical protein